MNTVKFWGDGRITENIEGVQLDLIGYSVNGSQIVAELIEDRIEMDIVEISSQREESGIFFDEDLEFVICED